MKIETDFGKSIARLEEIVAELEKGNCSLEDSIKLFEEGTALSKHCYKIIDSAKLKVETMLSNEEGI